MATSQKCPRCHEKSATMQKRFYSDKAAAFLIGIAELTVKSIDQPICHFCYIEVRDLLVDESAGVVQAKKKTTKKKNSKKELTL